MVATFGRPAAAEEEDEHLERTLEQNKGKMAKKEEKCVLQ
ncbi:PREDICTED: EH domain-binding protein 1-like [Tinamus guttatus]|nr:PREDICTED: EH domain-binding protein 1-like [Tinamus guttatus]